MTLAAWATKLAESHLTYGLVYDLVILFWHSIITIFFRETRPRGAYHIPRDGPVIFAAAPHHNQFLDMMLALHVYRETGRRVRFLVAAKSMHGLIGSIGRLTRSIPVTRAADEAKSCTGKVALSNDDPCLVVGFGTKFLSELEPRMQILLPKSVGSLTAEVLEVKSDSEVVIKKEFGGDSGKGTAYLRKKMQELGQESSTFKRIPHLDQQNTYHHVYECLKEGGCIVIFPEGGSHDRTDLLPFKAGVSLMALGAMANNPGLKVKIVPVGLSYFHAHKFRSRAVVEFGSAMDVPGELVDMFQQGGPKKREAVGKLLDVIYDGLKTVTIRAPDYDTLMFIQAARRLYVTPGQHLTLGQVVELNKRFLESYQLFKDEPRVQQLRADVVKYNRRLRDLGIRDHQVPSARKASWKTLGLLLYRVLLLFVWAVLALPGVILNAPIFITAKVVSRRKAREALAASVVKVAARDVIGSWKVLISLGLAPVLYGLYALLAELIVVWAGAPFVWKLWTPICVIVALPVIAYAALKFGEAGLDVFKSLRPLVLALLPGQERLLDDLKETRRRLANEAIDIVNKFGPQMYADFNERGVRTTSLPPPSGQAGLPHARNALDGQGKLLVHPMVWLDDRLFGWSRSASRTSDESASADGNSEHAFTQASPDLTDDEVGDYDDLVGYLDGKKIAAGRGAQSSYADLQKLRKPSQGAQMTASRPVVATGVTHLTPEAVDDDDGPRIRVSRHSENGD